MKARSATRWTFVLIMLALTMTGGAQGPPNPPAGPCCWPPIPAAQRPVDYWPFDEPSGITSADFAGATNNIGTDHGSIPRVPGSVGRAIDLKGSQWVQAATGSEVNFGGDCSTSNAEPGTIAFWISTTQASGVATVLDKREKASNQLRGYSVFLWNGRIGFQMATGAGNLACNSPGSACSNFIATTLPPIADGNWHFVAISFSRCNNPTGLFYVDGATAPFSPRVGTLANTSSLYVGRSVPAMPGASNFTGLLDELTYFKHAHGKTVLDELRTDKCHQKCWLK